MNPQELYEAYMSVYEDEDRRELRRLASQERQAEKKAESEFRSKSGIGAKKSGPKLSATKMSKGEGENYAKQTMKDAEHIAKKAKGHTVGNPFPEEFDLFDAVMAELAEAGYSVDEAFEVMTDINEAEKWIQKAIKKPGALHKQLGVPEGEKIPSGKLAAAAKKGGKLGQRARLAQTLGRMKEEAEIEEKEKEKDEGGKHKEGKHPKGKEEKGEKKTEKEMNESQYARNNPEKYEREQEKKQSSRERRMNDPKTGINSKAFNDFYNAQMRGKKA